MVLDSIPDWPLTREALSVRDPARRYNLANTLKYGDREPDVDPVQTKDIIPPRPIECIVMVGVFYTQHHAAYRSSLNANSVKKLV